jgi:hypothetical protein
MAALSGARAPSATAMGADVCMHDAVGTMAIKERYFHH